jgi:hypothetical protein
MYVPAHDDKKEQFIIELYHICAKIKDPMILGGDLCGRTNLNYTGSSTQILSQGLQRTSNGVTSWPVG